MKALGYIGAFLGGALAGAALGLIRRYLTQLTTSATSMTSN